jgi:hypothetical protein
MSKRMSKTSKTIQTRLNKTNRKKVIFSLSEIYLFHYLQDEADYESIEMHLQALTQRNQELEQLLVAADVSFMN